MLAFFLLHLGTRVFFLTGTKATNVNHRKAIMRVKLLPYCYQAPLWAQPMVKSHHEIGHS